MMLVEADVAIIPLNELPALVALGDALPALFTPDAKAAERFFDFFTANIRNKNTRRAYFRGLRVFDVVRRPGTA